MVVANATEGITTNLRIYFTLFIICIQFLPIMAMKDIKCPKNCRCYSAFVNDLTSPPTYISAPSDQEHTVLAVSCQRQQLSYVPKGFSVDTVVISLAYNKLKYLNRSMFEGLRDIRTLDLSNNQIERIEKDTFDDMKKLEHLQLSYNELRDLPNGFLCPWSQETSISIKGIIRCEESSTAMTKLSLNLAQNPWHCNCKMQSFVYNFICSYGKSPCIDFIKDGDSIGQCRTPRKLHGSSLSRLSFDDEKEKYNVCVVKSHVDVPLLITMFLWISALIGYAIYVVVWNQRDIANHSSYLASLNTKGQRHTEFVSDRSDSILSESPNPSARASARALARKPIHKRISSKQSIEMKTIRKETPAISIRQSIPPMVWVERSLSDASLDSGRDNEADVQSLKIRSSFLQNKVRCSASCPSNLQDQPKEEAFYKMSSL